MGGDRSSRAGESTSAGGGLRGTKKRVEGLGFRSLGFGVCQGLLQDKTCQVQSGMTRRSGRCRLAYVLSTPLVLLDARFSHRILEFMLVH